ncbi:cytosine/adenosine deaminase-related metal-dependent hydrolase [Bradyrhizobium sp. LB7.2]
MDDAIGDFSTGDVLIERNRIVDVRPSIDVGSSAAETEIVDGTGRIVIPGLINAHMHTWQTALRGYAANWTLLEYFRRMHAGLATVFRPEDIYIATLVGALNQINCGTTTLVDWCHNNPTPDHTDAAVRGLIESGIRAAFFHGSPKPEPKPGERHFSEVPHPRPRGRAAAGGAPHRPRRPRHAWARDPRPALFDARRRHARFPHGAGAQADRIDASGRRSREDA